MENCKLPRDLVVDILAKLPVKSLMRFKCVCKFFNDLIKSDYHFMHKHFEISKAKTYFVLLEIGGGLIKEYYLLYKESECNEIGCIYLDIPIMTRRECVKCCQGMLCFIFSRNDLTKLDGFNYLIYDILIWNPAIRKTKSLSSITLPYKLSKHSAVTNEFGFGISNNMTWKVVMILEIGTLSEGRRNTHQITMVYSQVASGSWSWRQINSVISCQTIYGNDFYLKGKYYWRAKSDYNETYKQHLLWFDMDDEVFGTTELPSNVDIVSVTIMNETIALLGYPSLGEFSCIEIWLMIGNDNTTYWRKQTSIDCVANLYNNELWRPLGIWNVDSQLLVFPYTTLYWDLMIAERDVPDFIFVDLITQERKMFYISQERKTISIASDPSRYFEVYSTRNSGKREEWMLNIFLHYAIYARLYGESLYLL